MLGEVVAPWRRPRGVLIVVLDGMSAAIATGLAAEVARMGFVEWVPASTHQRQSVVAALPSLTNVSRASLFCGEVRSGAGDDEKRGLATAFPGAQLFHKNDLRSDAGAALPEAVTKAIQSTAVPVVGAVINAIDDATHKNDTSAQEWSIRSLDPLRALLDAALAAQRTVILTSDHGHIVERSSEALNVSGAESRWRPTATGAVVDGEVSVSGSRVVAPGGEAVLLWRSDAHYGPRHAGYHGGASLAELAIPVLVFQAAIVTTGADGWEQAAPQVPLWWNDPVDRATSTENEAKAKPQSRKVKKPVQPSQGEGLFEIGDAPTIPSGLVEAVIASATYAEQKRMASRRPLDDSTTAAVLGALVDRGGRAHQDTVAAAAGIAAIDFNQVFAAVRRLLNIDGYGVIELDTDGVTLRLDESLLREQFELGNAR